LTRYAAPIRIIRRRALVLGSGVAGLTTALAMEGATVLTKTPLGAGGSSAWAQGGIAAAVDAEDDPRDHAADTIRVSAGLAVPDVVKVLTDEGPEAIDWLIDLGAEFDRTDGGDFLLGREAGHGRRRILHADGDATGVELMRALRGAAVARRDMEVADGVALDLLRSDGSVVGVLVEDAQGDRIAYLAPAVVMATGGIGHTFSRTTNPAAVSGDGVAMAARAGVALTDLEFVQFHPTALAVGADPMPLLTEALRGEGAILVDQNGHRYMADVHHHGELAPRDVVARATYRLLADGGTAYLDATEAVGEAFPERFPTVFNYARQYAYDPRVHRLPVSPAAHYHMGGIEVDDEGRSNRPGLWAVGEASSTGVHGANRLASNALLEGLVFGRRVASDIGRMATNLATEMTIELPAAALRRRMDTDATVLCHLRELMWSHVGVERNGTDLATARDRFDSVLSHAPSTRLRNLALVGRLVSEAALLRAESRGGHFRTDFPDHHREFEHRHPLVLPPENGARFGVKGDWLLVDEGADSDVAERV